MRIQATLSVSDHTIVVYEGDATKDQYPLKIQVLRDDKLVCKPALMTYLGNDLVLEFSNVRPTIKVKHG